MVVLVFAVGLQAANLASVLSGHRAWTNEKIRGTSSTDLAVATGTAGATTVDVASVQGSPGLGNQSGALDAPLPNGPAPLYWTDGGETYRAVHFVAKWNKETHKWEQISPDLTQAFNPAADGYGIDGITAVAQSGTAWYVGTLAGSVAVKTGAEWEDKSFGLPPRTVTAIAICPDVGGGTMAAVGFGGYGTATPDLPGHVYVTFDAGDHWMDVTGDLPDAPVQSLHFARQQGRTQLLVRVEGKWYAMSPTKGHWDPRNA
jgi:hypothetical protein